MRQNSSGSLFINTPLQRGGLRFRKEKPFQRFPALPRIASPLHRKRTYADKVKWLAERYGLAWRDDKTVKTVFVASAPPTPR